jgi:hypothetical protein
MDTLAVAELKLHEESCQIVAANSAPDFVSAHAPLGQVLLYTLDAWHSIARRGYHLQSGKTAPTILHMIVLAARRKDKSISLVNHLCCMEADFRIPQGLGDRFWYQIDRCVRFPNGEQEVDILYTQAICGFIKTMRIGLTFAQSLRGESEPAVTLCCSPPHPDLELLASPIPCANQPRSSFVISQGELHKYAGASITVADFMKGLADPNDLDDPDSVCLFGPPDSDMIGSLVKLTCRTVHSFFVPSETNWRALRRLVQYGSADLKSQIGKVLLGCSYINARCCVMVMKDLSFSGRDALFNGFETSLARWEAFSRLARQTLVPMACNGIVHTDIRFDPATLRIHNVIPVTNEAGKPSEMCLVDFESLVEYKSAKMEMQQYAISLAHVKETQIHMFLFWQLVWVALGFQLERFRSCMLCEARALVKLLFSEDARMQPVRKLFGQRTLKGLRANWESLHNIRNAASEEFAGEIGETLSILGVIFQ